jgi:hypothetical protein
VNSKAPGPSAVIGTELPVCPPVRKPTQEWFEYEEVAGPDPNPPPKCGFGVPESINVVFVKPYSQQL